MVRARDGTIGLGLAAAVVGLVSFAVPPPARACSCRLLSHAEAVRGAAVAFEGRAAAQRPGPDGTTVTTFVVTRAWKGVRARARVEIASEREGMCPVPAFSVGRTYRVYGDGQGAPWTVGGCNPSREVRVRPTSPRSAAASG